MNRLALACLLFLLPACATSQVTDWNSLKSLPGGTRIKVQLIHGRTFDPCVLDSVTDEQLSCTFGGTFWSDQKTFPRSNVKAVFHARNGTAIGTAIGASTGTILGVATPGCCRVARGFLGAVAFGALGAVVGTAAGPFLHGRAVYRKGNNSPAPPRPSPPAQSPSPSGPDAADTGKEQKIPCLRDGTTLQCLDPFASGASENTNHEPPTTDQSR